MLSSMLSKYEEKSEHANCSLLAGPLIYALIESGELNKAMQLAKRKFEWTRLVGWGPLSQLSDVVQQLQVLNSMGRYQEVYTAVCKHRRNLDEIAQQKEQDEKVDLWKVRETLLHTGLVAAVGIQYWQSALEFNQARVESERERGALDIEISRMLFDNYSPLLRLGYTDQARVLLEQCRRDFDKEHDYEFLAKSYGALGNLEHEIGRAEAALRFEKAAVKFRYIVGQPGECAISHSNLAIYIEACNGNQKESLCHQFAAAVINYQTNSGGFSMNVANLREFLLHNSPPSFDEVVETVERIDGVRFRDLFTKLPLRSPDGDAALSAISQLVHKQAIAIQETLSVLPDEVQLIIKQKKGKEAFCAIRKAIVKFDLEKRKAILHHLNSAGLLQTEGEPTISEQTLHTFAPFLQAIANVARGEAGEQSRRELELEVEVKEKHGWWLADEVQRIWGGERNPDRLSVGLDSNSAYLVRRILYFIDEAKLGGLHGKTNIGMIWLSLPLSIRIAFSGTGIEAQHDLSVAMSSLSAEQSEQVDKKLCELGFVGAGPESKKQKLSDFSPLFDMIISVARGAGDKNLRIDAEYGLLFMDNGGWCVKESVTRIWNGERDAVALTRGIVDHPSIRFVQRVLELLREQEVGR